MKRILIVVDMQKDFENGALGTPEAATIVPAAEKIRVFEGPIFVTYDTHGSDYPDMAEGRKLPVPHCVKGTSGWELDAAIQDALSGKAYTAVEKNIFGSVDLPGLVGREAAGEAFSLELIGLCTDICVVSNALLLKAHFPEAPIAVDASCCAGVTPAKHLAALETMASCQIDIK